MSAKTALLFTDELPVPAAIRYDSGYEAAQSDEQATQQGLHDTIEKIQHTVFVDNGKALRGVHAKCHGILTGRLHVLAGLPPVLAQGLFAVAADYPVIMRFSTIPGDVLDDGVSVPRGLAVKVVGVPGARVTGSEDDVTQDFVLANGTSFAKAKPADFLRTLKLLAATTDKAQGLKKALSVVMRGTEKVLETLGHESATLKTLGGFPAVHILGDEFYSQAPILYGDFMVKVRLKPMSSGLRALAKAPIDLDRHANAIRDAVVEFFARQSGEWELQVQLCTDIEAMPLEDAAKEWPEDQSPYITVARIVVPQQNAWDEARQRIGDAGMSFSPWHALAAHRPLGAIMRARQRVYAAAARFRAEHNGVSIKEPRGESDLPS